MEMHKVRTAVIGVGSMGQHHARIYSQISNLIGVVDFDIEQGEKMATKFNTDYFSDISDIIGKVDAVSIVVPTKHHLKVASELIKNGINVLIEKPLALNSEESNVLVQTSESSDVTVSVGHIERFNPVISYLKSNLENNNLGELINVTARRFSQYPKRITDVGVLFDLSVHDLDILNYLVDNSVDSLYATRFPVTKQNLEENVNININFSNGVNGVCQTSWLYPSKKRDLSLLTSSHLIEVDYMNQQLSLTSHLDSSVENIKLDFKEPLLSELEDFLSSILEKRNPKTTVNDGASAVILAEACKKSIETESVIKFN